MHIIAEGSDSEPEQSLQGDKSAILWQKRQRDNGPVTPCISFDSENLESFEYAQKKMHTRLGNRAERRGWRRPQIMRLSFEDWFLCKDERQTGCKPRRLSNSRDHY